MTTPQGPGYPPPPPPPGAPAPYAQPYAAQQPGYATQPYPVYPSQQYANVTHAIEGHHYQPTQVHAPPGKGGSPAKIILTVFVAVGLIGGGALLVTQLSKKKGGGPVAGGGPAATFTPSTQDRPRPTIDNRTTSTLGSATTVGTRPATTRGGVDTRPPVTTRGGGVGQTVEVGQGVSVSVLPGWDVVRQDEGIVVLAKGSAVLRAETAEVGSVSADSVVSALLQFVSEVLTGLETGQIESVTPPKSNILSAATAPFQGILASQQGSIDQAGLALGFVRQDGLALGIIVAFEPSQADQAVEEAGEMIASLLGSF